MLFAEEINCRSDSFIAPSKALVNRGRGSVEMKNRITLRDLIYMVLGTSNDTSPGLTFDLFLCKM